MTAVSSKAARHIFPALFQRVGWLITVLLLLFIPFQLLLHDRLSLPRRWLWIDELIVLAALALFLCALAAGRRCRPASLAVFWYLVFLVVLAAASAIYNGNPLVPSFAGGLNLVKSFLPIPVLSLWAFGRKRVEGLYRFLYRLAIFFCLAAIFQEIAFLAGWPLDKLGVTIVDDRFYFLRAPSLLYHANVFGLYALLFFLLDFSLRGRFRPSNLLLLLGVVLSSSRVAWAALLIGLCYLLALRNRKLVLVLFPAAVILAVFLLPYFQAWKERELTYEKYFRRYTVIKSVEIWRDYPLLGVGPGMFGGWVGEEFISPVFERYNFAPVWLENLREHRTLDCFWAQHLAENGLLGITAFVVFLWLLWRIAWREAQAGREDPFRKKLLAGLSAMPLVIALYLTGQVLNVTPFLLTYSILLGLLLGPEEAAPHESFDPGRI